MEFGLVLFLILVSLSLSVSTLFNGFLVLNLLFEGEVFSILIFILFTVWCNLD
ncbi:hypothetical protein QBC41DRAFT_309250 [Cercophora samala]|uniref:Uncharacterized protein n=1 Tax=Cercophora samala TaxID=330535 RepID=A0AA39ZNV0_9PEZI|nr:hypothetical protein QBC41DRAFT_309250 [Cercophora samala]